MIFTGTCHFHNLKGYGRKSAHIFPLAWGQDKEEDLDGARAVTWRLREKGKKIGENGKNPVIIKKGEIFFWTDQMHISLCNERGWGKNRQ